MSDAEQFDAFYTRTRDRLLVLAFALTGDLPASRGAVRDGFVSAWHHWRKVKRLPDPEGWVRPHVWAHAQRRHTARIWHRDRNLDPELKATLDALAKVPVTSRKVLLLTQLTDASRQDMARAVGLTLDEAEQRLQQATSQFALHREVSSTAVRPLLDALREHCTDQRWPRATIVRRAGAARRRSHAVAGAALVVAALVVSGFVVADSDGVHPTLEAAGHRITAVPSDGTGEDARPIEGGGTPISPQALLTRAQVSRAVQGRQWKLTGTDPTQGRALPCQEKAYADPEAATSIVRNFTSSRRKGQPQLAAVQTVELSKDAEGAAKGFDAATAWFAGCTVGRTQLLGVRRIKGLGDEAEQFALQSWATPRATIVVGLARTGRLTTVALTRTSGDDKPDLGANLRLLVSAVDDLCPTAGGGLCSALPKPEDVPAPPTGELPMMLDVLDLPGVTGVDRPWAGTTPRRALGNLAATGCDQTSFRGNAWQHAMTRTFLVPGARLATAFGLTETVGEQRNAGSAKAVLANIRQKLATCSDRELGSKVLRLANQPDLSVWRVQTKVSDKQTVTFDMGVVRHGNAVAQVGFVPDGRHTMTTAQFVALVRRAGERLGAMTKG
jgi:DNA-directed RNA polymerase specialized sigma24 family protein